MFNFRHLNNRHVKVCYFEVRYLYQAFAFQLQFLGSGSDESSSCLEPGPEENEGYPEEEGYEDVAPADGSDQEVLEAVYLVDEQAADPSTLLRVFLNDVMK